MATENTNTTRIVIAVVGLLVVGGLYYGLKSKDSGKVKYPRGTVMAIDPVGRTATIEIVHTKSGQKILISGNIPDGCTVLIDGKPATLADVRVGDVVELERVAKEIKAVRIKRTAVGPVSGPASGPAAETRPATQAAGA